MGSNFLTKNSSVDEIVEQFRNSGRRAAYTRINYFKRKGDTENYEKLLRAYEIMRNEELRGVGRKYGKIFGVAEIGEGLYNSSEHIKEVNMWNMLIRRCYCPKIKSKQLCYKNTSMSDFFLNFQNFMGWAATQKNSFKRGFELDKDLLVKGNQVYSENTCVFIPKEINIAISRKILKDGDLPQGVRRKDSGKYSARCYYDGKENHIGVFVTIEEASNAYKIVKKQQIVRLAEKWREDIEANAYFALLDFEV